MLLISSYNSNFYYAFIDFGYFSFFGIYYVDAIRFLREYYAN
jgi:hypothetical protein